MTLRLPPVGRTFPWFILILVGKLILAAFFVSQSAHYLPNTINDYGITISKDYGELLGVVDNYFEHGAYSIDLETGTPYTGRLPGYSAPYLFLQSFLGKEIALLVLILLQLLLSSLATVRIAQCVYGMTLKRRFFFVTMMIVGFAFYSVAWETWTYPESFALSAWLLAVYHFYKSWGSARWWHFLLAGIFMAWAFFLRGFLGVFYIAFGLAFLWQWIRTAQRQRLIIQFCFFLLPLLVFESAWVLRNKLSTGKIILLQSSFGWGEELNEYSLDKAYKPSMLSLRDLIACWGGDNVHYYQGSDMSYFTMKSDPGSFFPFRKEIFFDGFERDSLIHIRQLVQESFNSELDLESRIQSDNRLKAKAERLSAKFKADRSFYVYVKGSFYKLKNLVLQNVVGNWPGPSFSESSVLYKVYKLLVLFVYFGGIIVGAISCLWLILRKNNDVIFHVLWASSVLLLLCFSLLINTAEFKYFMTGALNLSLIGLLGLAELLSLLRRKRAETL